MKSSRIQRAMSAHDNLYGSKFVAAEVARTYENSPYKASNFK